PRTGRSARDHVARLRHPARVHTKPEWPREDGSEVGMAKPTPFLLAPHPYVGDGLGKEPRFPTRQEAEASAKARLANGGDWLNIVEEKPVGRVILATVSCDAMGVVWVGEASPPVLL